LLFNKKGSLVVVEMKTVQINVPGWQTACGDLARAGEVFILVGSSRANAAFFKDFCVIFRYKKSKTHEGLLFTPRSTV
jgi:hypothetical protein